MQPKPFKVSHAIRPRLNHPIPEFMAAEVYRRQWTTDDEARPQTYTYIDSASMSNVEKFRKNQRSGTTIFLCSVCVLILHPNLGFNIESKIVKN